MYLNTHKTLNPQVARWYDLLQEYDFDVKYRPGCKMMHVDALSRAPLMHEDKQQQSVEEGLTSRIDVLVALTVEEKATMAQHNDDDLQSLVAILCKGEEERSTYEREQIKGFCLQNNLLYREFHDKLLLVMPRSMRKSITVTAHDLNGHQSVERTIDHIREHFWFISMRRYVRLHIRMCFEPPRGTHLVVVRGLTGH